MFHWKAGLFNVEDLNRFFGLQMVRELYGFCQLTLTYAVMTRLLSAGYAD